MDKLSHYSHTAGTQKKQQGAQLTLFPNISRYCAYEFPPIHKANHNLLAVVMNRRKVTEGKQWRHGAGRANKHNTVPKLPDKIQFTICHSWALSIFKSTVHFDQVLRIYSNLPWIKPYKPISVSLHVRLAAHRSSVDNQREKKGFEWIMRGRRGRVRLYCVCADEKEVANKRSKNGERKAL